jgi:hypothetical protein
MFKYFNNCPLCKSKEFKPTKLGYKNRYLEDISKNLKYNEDILNAQILNLQCDNCGLIFKKKWFNKKYLNFIFNRLIPVHPKGWDKYSKKFSKSFFLKKFEEFKKNISNVKKTYFLRELNAIIDSIYSSNKKKYIKISFFKKKFKNSNTLKEGEINFLANSIKYPEANKRFAGFGGELLFKEIEKKIGIIKNYAEVGCPLWGNLDYLSKNKNEINCYYIKPDQDTFWGKSCKNKQGLICSSVLLKKIKIYENLEAAIKEKKKFDFISVFLCLDHIDNPVRFLFKLKKISKSIGFILEPSSSGVPIQHFTGWNKESIQFLANKINYKIYNLSYLLKNINHSFFLLYK